MTNRSIRSIDCRRFRCCSFAAAAAAIGLSSIADAPAVAVDRSTTVVAAIAAFNLAEHKNYDESINRKIDLNCCCPILL